MLRTPPPLTPLWLKQDCSPHRSVREAAKGGPIAWLCSQATGLEDVISKTEKWEEVY